MSNVVKLADPEASPLKVCEDRGLDVVLRVTHSEMECGRTTVRDILLTDPSARMREWTEDGHTEEELRLLSGLFVALSNAMPMLALHYILWGRLIDDCAVDQYVMWRMKQLDDDAFDYVLEGRDLTTLGIERLDKPRSRGPASFSAARKAIEQLPLHELVQLEEVLSSRIGQLKDGPA